MNKWLGLAATIFGHLRKTAGAKVAASTLTTVFFLQGEEPPFWEILGRILKAFGEILFHWPEGVPINGASIIIQVLEATDIFDVGAKFEEFLLTITQVPPLEGTIFGALIIASMIPAWGLFFFHSARYWAAYRRHIKTPGGEDAVWSNQAEIVNPNEWFVQRFLVMFVVLAGLTAITIGPQLVVNIVWKGMGSVAQVFYEGAETTIGGAFVELLSRMAEGQGALSFVLSFLVIFVGGFILLIVYAVRFIKWFAANLTFGWRAAKTLSGRRNVTLAEPVKEYAEKLAAFAITALLIVLGPLLAVAIPAIYGLPQAGVFLIVIWLAIKLPSEAIEHGDEYYRRFGRWFEGDLVSPDEPSPPRPPGRIRQATSRVGSMAHDYAKSDPRYAQAAAVASGLKAARDRGFANTAMDEMDERIKRRGSSIGGPAGGRPRYNPQTDTLKRMPPKLYERRHSLHGDRRMNNAMFAYLADTYERTRPMRQFNDLAASAREEVAALRKQAPTRFEMLAQRGTDLISAAETNRGEYSP